MLNRVFGAEVVEKIRLSVKCGKKILDAPVEGVIALAGPFHFSDGVQDGGMVFPPEALAYLG